MAFYGYEFMYNGIASSNFHLFITSIDGSGVEQSNIGSEIKLITKKILRNPVEHLYGVEQSPVLEFDLEFNSPSPLTATDRSVISSWLFGQQNRAKLQIMQDDLQSIYFNCLMVSSEVTYVGKLSYGFKAHVVCDSPFAWEYPRSVSETFGAGTITNKTIEIYNSSADNYYTFPTVTFKTNSIGNSFSITNVTDSNRVFAFTGLLANETISVDCGKQIIVTDAGLHRIQNFSLGWLRMPRGLNTLQIFGGVLNYSITYPVARKVGG